MALSDGIEYAQDEGWQAFHAGLGPEDAPPTAYPVLTDAWVAGWHEAKAETSSRARTSTRTRARKRACFYCGEPHRGEYRGCDPCDRGRAKRGEQTGR